MRSCVSKCDGTKQQRQRDLVNGLQGSSTDNQGIEQEVVKSTGMCRFDGWIGLRKQEPMKVSSVDNEVVGLTLRRSQVVLTMGTEPTGCRAKVLKLVRGTLPEAYANKSRGCNE